MQQQNKLPRFLSAEELTELVRSVRAHEAGADARLYQVLRNAFRYYLTREMGPDNWEDPLHNAFLSVLKAIRNGTLNNPKATIAYAHTAIYREICTDIQQRVRYRERQGEENPDPVDTAPHMDSRIEYRRRVAVMREALNQLSQRDQELLRRFYLLEQPEAQIRREMNLTGTQFRLYKSRAKSRLGMKGNALQRPSLRRDSAKAKSA